MKKEMTLAQTLKLKNKLISKINDAAADMIQRNYTMADRKSSKDDLGDKLKIAKNLTKLKVIIHWWTGQADGMFRSE